MLFNVIGHMLMVDESGRVHRSSSVFYRNGVADFIREARAYVQATGKTMIVRGCYPDGSIITVVKIPFTPPS